MKHVILAILAGLCCLVLTACAATPPVAATPEPTATRRSQPPRQP